MAGTGEEQAQAAKMDEEEGDAGSEDIEDESDEDEDDDDEAEEVQDDEMDMGHEGAAEKPNDDPKRDSPVVKQPPQSDVMVH